MSTLKKWQLEQANQWFKYGDHPNDNCEIDENGRYTQAEIVRHFRNPNPKFAGNKFCPKCDDTYHYHGWLDIGGDGITVCPSNWVVPGDDGKYFAISNEEYNIAYLELMASPSLEKEFEQLDLPITSERMIECSNQIELPLDTKMEPNFESIPLPKIGNLPLAKMGDLNNDD